MIRFPVYLIFVALCACSQERNTSANQENVRTADPSREFKWPVETELQMKRRASSGDIEATKDLYNHYLLVGDQASADQWEGTLVADGYVPAMVRKSEVLLERAQKLGDRDLEKPKLLMEALALVSKAKSLPRPKQVKAMVNGREIMIPNNGPEELQRSVEQELQKMRSTEGKKG